ALEQFLRVPDRDRAEAARAHLALGRARALRGEFDRAEASFQQTTELSNGPLAAEAQYRIGEARRQAGQLQAAADAFVKLPILYAHEEWVRKGLLAAGLVYEQLQQPDKAKRFFAELVDKYPDSAEAKAAKDRLRNG
ncbi:MAG: tetratricopeptide repeat protein, partial [Planctomycetes bacterium]|nr:tetratricopeptide repeat protein [Planctomycetota bacterium]